MVKYKCINTNVTESECLSSWFLWIESTTAHKHSEEHHGEFFKQPKYKSSKKSSPTSDSQRNFELERVWNSCDTFILSAVWLKKESTGLPAQLSIYMLLIMITFFFYCAVVMLVASHAPCVQPQLHLDISSLPPTWATLMAGLPEGTTNWGNLWCLVGAVDNCCGWREKTPAEVFQGYKPRSDQHVMDQKAETSNHAEEHHWGFLPNICDWLMEH